MTSQTVLENQIEDLRLDDKSPSDIDKISEGLSSGMPLRRQRKELRYKCYRMRTEATEGPSPPNGFREAVAHLETMKGFDGWKNFAITWDISMEDITKIVSRQFSEFEEWDRVVKAKFPIIEPGGNIVYPDKKVEEAVKAAAKE